MIGFKLTDLDPVVLVRAARRLAAQDPGNEQDYMLAALMPSNTTYFVQDDCADLVAAWTCAPTATGGTLVRNTRSRQNT